MLNLYIKCKHCKYLQKQSSIILKFKTYFQVLALSLYVFWYGWNFASSTGILFFFYLSIVKKKSVKMISLNVCIHSRTSHPRNSCHHPFQSTSGDRSKNRTQVKAKRLQLGVKIKQKTAVAQIHYT